jgi:squalene cyclase
MDLIHKIDLSSVNQSVENGTTYLLSQATNGRWRGFPTLAGESDIWVTGFVVAHIYKICEQEEAIEEAQNFLIKSRQPTNGWSYSTIVPSDADSTAWCLMALQSCSILTGLELDKAKLFLWSHFVANGISTYHVESGIREFISVQNNEAIQGWTSAHPDVSIAAVLADINNEKVPEILSWLINQQTNEGFIDSYWWRSPFYTTTLLLRALSLRQESLPYEHANKITQSLVNRQLRDGGFGLDTSTSLDPFTTALSLESFVHLSDTDSAPEKHLCAKSLLQSQNKDGSWDGNYILRIPAPNMLDPNQVVAWNSDHGGGNSFIKDQDGLFATALACNALDCYKRTEMNKMNDISSKTPKK